MKIRAPLRLWAAAVLLLQAACSLSTAAQVEAPARAQAPQTLASPVHAAALELFRGFGKALPEDHVLALMQHAQGLTAAPTATRIAAAGLLSALAKPGFGDDVARNWQLSQRLGPEAARAAASWALVLPAAAARDEHYAQAAEMLEEFQEHAQQLDVLFDAYAPKPAPPLPQNWAASAKRATASIAAGTVPPEDASALTRSVLAQVPKGPLPLELRRLLYYAWKRVPEQRSALSLALVKGLSADTPPPDRYAALEMAYTDAARDASAKPALTAALAEVEKASSGPLRREARAIRERLTEGDTLDGRQRVWARIAAAIEPAKPRGGKTSALSRALWAQTQRAPLEEHLPSLHALLDDPPRMLRFLSALSQLRLTVPYHLANDSDLAPMEWSQRHGYVFAWKELRIYPVSESFRRFVLANEDGSYAVEIKIPGQEESRDVLYDDHFEVGRWLAEEYPGFARFAAAPVYFGEYLGVVSLYGKRQRFSKDRPLGLILLRYEDGKRLSNAQTFLPRVAQERGVPQFALAHFGAADMLAVTAALHSGGWKGTLPKTSDMHSENVRVLKNGRMVLAGDYGAFQRISRLPARALRRGELLSLIGFQKWHRTPANNAVAPVQGLPLLGTSLQAIVVDALSAIRSAIPDFEAALKVMRQLGGLFGLDVRRQRLPPAPEADALTPQA